MKAKSKRKLVLASSSPRRKFILLNVGASFEIDIPDVDENIDPKTKVPAELSLELAKLKTKAISKKNKNAIVIGADTIVVAENEVLGKPETLDEAFSFIKRLQGNVHQVITGFCLICEDDDYVVSDFESTDVYVMQMSDAEISDYIKNENILDAAGAYKIQGTFAKHIEKVNGSYENVIGLPISKIYKHLSKNYNLGWR